MSMGELACGGGNGRVLFLFFFWGGVGLKTVFFEVCIYIYIVCYSMFQLSLFYSILGISRLGWFVGFVCRCVEARTVHFCESNKLFFDDACLFKVLGKS